MADNRSPESASQAVKNGKGLTIASCVCGPLSLLLGSCLISAVGLVLGIVGRKKLSGADSLNRSDYEYAQKYFRLSTSAIIVCALALVVNIVVIVLYYPDIMAQYNSMLGNGGAGSSSLAFGGMGSGGAPSTSAWG